MNKIIKRITIAFSIIAGILFVSVSAFFFWLFSGSCVNYYIEELSIPNTDYKAVAFVKNCGALSSFSTHVSILKEGKELKHNDIGNIFSCDKSEEIHLSLINDKCIQIHYTPHHNSNTRFEKGRYCIDIKMIESIEDHSLRYDYDSLINLDSLMHFQEVYFKKLSSQIGLINSFRQLEYRDGRWCKRIFLDTAASYVMKKNLELFECKTSGKYALQSKSIPKVVTEFARFLIDYEISTFDWDKNGVAFIGVKNDQYWYRYSNYPKDTTFIGNEIVTDIGYRIVGNRKSKLLIIDPFWKFGVTLKKSPIHGL